MCENGLLLIVVARTHEARPYASPFGQLTAVQIGYPADLSLRSESCPLNPEIAAMLALHRRDGT